MPNSTLEKSALRPPAHGHSNHPATTVVPTAQIDTLFRRPHTPSEERWLKVAREVSDEFSKTAAERYIT